MRKKTRYLPALILLRTRRLNLRNGADSKFRNPHTPGQQTTLQYLAHCAGSPPGHATPLRYSTASISLRLVVAGCHRQQRSSVLARSRTPSVIIRRSSRYRRVLTAPPGIHSDRRHCIFSDCTPVISSSRSGGRRRSCRMEIMRMDSDDQQTPNGIDVPSLDPG